jgi:hypothetical protein
MNNPWPSREQLRCEAIASRLLGEQLEAEMAFRAIVQTALTAIKALDFPLACPAPGYDLDDITGALADWLNPEDQAVLNSLAFHAANDILDEAA